MIYSVIYIVIGVVLAFYWFDKEYKEEYNKVKEEEGAVEDSIVCLLLLFFMVFWPIKLLYNFFKWLR